MASRIGWEVPKTGAPCLYGLQFLRHTAILTCRVLLNARKECDVALSLDGILSLERGYARFALIENRQRIAQAMRNLQRSHSSAESNSAGLPGPVERPLDRPPPLLAERDLSSSGQAQGEYHQVANLPLLIKRIQTLGETRQSSGAESSCFMIERSSDGHPKLICLKLEQEIHDRRRHQPSSLQWQYRCGCHRIDHILVWNAIDSTVAEQDGHP